MNKHLHISALVLSLLVFTKVRLNESRFLTALFFIGSLKPLLQGIASEPWLFYIGKQNKVLALLVETIDFKHRWIL